MSSAIKQHSEINLRTLEQLPVAVALFDNKKIFFLNKKAIHLFKISGKQLKNIDKINIFKLLDPSHHKVVKYNNIKILKGSSFPSIELNFKDFKGANLQLEINTNAVKLNGQNVIQSTFTEITERKKTEELLKETKEKFELITNNSFDIITFYTYFHEEKYLYVSPNITKILGFRPEELYRDYNFFNKRVVENKIEFLKIDDYLRKLQRKNIIKDYNYSYKVSKKNKEDVWIENNLVPIADEKGKIRFFLNVLRDVTGQKEKELELQQQYINYQNLLDSSQVAYVIHSQGTIVYCNKELLNMLKLKDKKQILGKFAVDFFAAEDRKRVINRIREVYKTKNLNAPAEYKLLDSKGNKIHVEIKSNLINYNNSPCIVSSIMNISQQRQSEREKLRSEITEQNYKLL